MTLQDTIKHTYKYKINNICRSKRILCEMEGANLLPGHVGALPGGPVVHGAVEGHRGHTLALLVVHLVTAATNQN